MILLLDTITMIL